MCAAQFYFIFLAFCCRTDELKIPTDWECPAPWSYKSKQNVSLSSCIAGFESDAW